MPFTTQQFLDVFASYNETVFPAQIVLLIAAVVAIRLARNSDGNSSKVVVIVLGLLWLWMGVVYHCLFFSEINGLAFLFGAFFILQALVLLYAGVARRDLRFGEQSGHASSIGSLLVAYALLIYPIIGVFIGHRYPHSPTFGLPCPTTIFTLGLFMRSGLSVPFYVLPIPIAWSFVGFSAAIFLGIWEDVGLLVAGLVAGFWLMGYRAKQSCELSA